MFTGSVVIKVEREEIFQFPGGSAILTQGNRLPISAIKQKRKIKLIRLFYNKVLELAKIVLDGGEALERSGYGIARAHSALGHGGEGSRTGVNQATSSHWLRVSCKMDKTLSGGEAVGTRLEIGDRVVVPDPSKPDDAWTYGNFIGVVVKIIPNGHVLVRDQDGDTWEIECERLETVE